MDLWVQEKYILELSNNLERFTRVSPALFNFRCPICGDSEKKKTKARGYIYQRNGHYSVHCHNCDYHKPFEIFLKTLNPELYYEAMKEGYTSNKSEVEFPQAKPVQVEVEPFYKNSKSINECMRFSAPYKYLINRKIPLDVFDELRYTDNYKEFVNNFFDVAKFKDKKHEIPRILIPFIDRKGKLFGFQGRAIDPKEEIRYISIILDETKPKLYGLNKINPNKKFYVLEGPFDSMLLPNAIAVCGSDVLSILLTAQIPKENAVIVLDNEPRNKEIVNNVNKAILKDYSVCIWPASWEYKDINEAILDGVSSSEVAHIIDENTYSDLEAKLKFQYWRKI